MFALEISSSDVYSLFGSDNSRILIHTMNALDDLFAECIAKNAGNAELMVMVKRRFKDHSGFYDAVFHQIFDNFIQESHLIRVQCGRLG